MLTEPTRETAIVLREGNDVLCQSNVALEVRRAQVHSEESIFTKFVSIGVDETLWFDAYDFLTMDVGLVNGLLWLSS